MHANTHIPIVIGAATAYEQSGDARFLDTAMGFYDNLNDGHTWATGGSSTGEWWGDPHRLGDGLDINGVESCSTYNVLKLSRQLFTWNLDTKFAEFYERAKFSGMFSTAHPSVAGHVIYLLPMRGADGMAGGSKVSRVARA